MKVLKFELKKMLKQKKYVWILLVMMLLTSALFMINSYQRSRLQGEWAIWTILDQHEKLTTEWESRMYELRVLNDEGKLNADQEKQMELARDMGQTLGLMRISYRFADWDRALNFERNFLDTLQRYAEFGGEFKALDGVDREIAILKNKWLLDNDLEFEYERSPLTPHLFLKDSSSVLLGIVGIILLLLFFGSPLIEEKENSTWNTLTTQPISKAKLIISKYIVFLLMAVFFILMFLAIGLLVPYIAGERTISFNYPQVLTSGENFKFITTGQYVLRGTILFFCASTVMYSMSQLVNKWVKRSIVSNILVGMVLILGFFLTSSIRTPFNPFYFLQFNEILSQIPQSTDWIYLLSSGFWTLSLLALTIYLPDREFKAVQNIEQKINQWLDNEKQYSKGVTKTKGKLVFKMISFEWRKFKRESLLRVFSVSTIGIILVSYFFLTNTVNEHKKDYFDELDWRISTMQGRIDAQESIIEDYRTKIEILESDPDADLEYEYEYDYHFSDPIAYYQGMISYHEDNIKTFLREIALIERAKDSFQKGDGKDFYQYQLHVNQLAIDGLTPTGGFFGGWNYRPGFTEEVSLAEKQWLLDNDIKPILTGEFLSNLHLIWRRDRTRNGWREEQVRQVEWERQNKTVDNSGLFYLYHSFTNHAYLVPLIFLLFFIGGGLAKEKGKKMTYNLLKTQPISDQSIFIGKTANAVAIVLASSLLIPLLIILVGTVYKGFGDWQYPILYHNPFRVTLDPNYTGFRAGFGQGYHFITLGRYLINSTMLYVSLGLFVISVSISLSLFFKRSLSVLSATTIVLVGGYWLNTRKNFQMSPLSPFSYFDIPKVVDGQLAARLNKPIFNTLTGSIVLLVMTMLVLGAAFAFVNRDRIYREIAKRRGKTKDSKGRASNDIIR